MNQSKLMLIGTIIFIVALLILLCIKNFLFLDITSNNKQKSLTNEEKYNSILENKSYLDNIKTFDKDSINEVNYTYYDIDDDKNDELIIKVSDSNDDFSSHLFYTFIDNKVTFISEIYHYGNLSYSKEDKAIVYTPIRPSTQYGYSFSYYQLKKTNFDILKTVGVLIENNKEKYFINDQDIGLVVSEEEFNELLAKNIDFEYQNLN